MTLLTWGKHVDAYSCIIVILLVLYGGIFLRWLRPDSPSSGDDTPSTTGKSSRFAFRRLIGGRHLNFSQWVVDPTVASEPCCHFIQALKTSAPALRYRYGVEYQSCCQDAYDGTPFAPLRYTGGPKFDGRRFLKAFKGKRVLFVGDSLMRQSITALICALERNGLAPKKVDKPAKQPWGEGVQLPEEDNMDFSAEYDGATRLERVSMRKFVNLTFGAVLGYADVIIVNLGAWYRRGQRLKFQDDVTTLVQGLAQFNSRPAKVALLVDTLPQHFITHRGSGDFYEKSNTSGCTAVSPERYLRSGGDWHSKIARKVAKKHAVPFVEVVDIFLPRGDAHMELRLKSNAQGKMMRKLDCSHWCQRNSLWAPLMARLQQALAGDSKRKAVR
eukprot:EG_transcript_12283